MYMTGDEIRALSRRIPEIVNATDEELLFWMDEAFDVLNNFCQQDFTYERQATKRVRATTNTLVYLPKVLSGQVEVKAGAQTIFSAQVGVGEGYAPSRLIELFPGQFVMGIHRYNSAYPTNDAHTLFVTGDWGYVNTSQELLLANVNDLRTLYDQHRLSTVTHSQADALNVVLSPPATDLESAAILLNELKGVLNSHFGDFTVHTVSDTNISEIPDVVDEASALVLLQDLALKFNTHIQSTSYHVEADTENILTTSTDPADVVMPRVIRRVFLRLVQRLAIRDEAEDHRQINSVYSNETLGDGYSYDLNNGTLRNLIRPEEAHMLLPYVNRGRVVI